MLSKLLSSYYYNNVQDSVEPKIDEVDQAYRQNMAMILKQRQSVQKYKIVPGSRFGFLTLVKGGK